MDIESRPVPPCMYRSCWHETGIAPSTKIKCHRFPFLVPPASLPFRLSQTHRKRITFVHRTFLKPRLQENWECRLPMESKEFSQQGAFWNEFDKLSHIFQWKKWYFISLMTESSGTVYSNICLFLIHSSQSQPNGCMKNGVAGKRLIEHWSFFNWKNDGGARQQAEH